MAMFCYDQDNCIEYRETPWNDKALGCKTVEVTSVKHGGEFYLPRLIKGFNDWVDNEGVSFVAYRNEADKRLETLLFQNAGYRYVETSLEIQLPNLRGFRPDPLFDKTISLRMANASDLECLQAIAVDAFHYGGFLEDPLVSPEQNVKRQRDWVADLYSSGATILVHENRGRPVAFMAFSVNNQNEVNLILGGCDAKSSMLAVFFWISVLKWLQNEGAGSVHTLISAANVGVSNLYARLGFKTLKTLVGLHWHSNC